MGKKFFIPFCFLIFPYALFSQLIINSQLNAAQLVNDVLLGGGVKVSNVKYTGSAEAIAAFNAEKSNVGFSQGILLSTGKVAKAIGPNNQFTTSGLGFGGTGDADLDMLLPQGFSTKDAAILEFDFIPLSDTLRFNYVFASEEYPEANCSFFNDVFSFMLSGPNPMGGNYNNYNIALIPGTNIPVSINTINSGVVGNGGDSTICSAINAQWKAYSSYFRNNGNGTNIYPQYFDSGVVQYDGLTVAFTAKAAIVPCQLYHIKIAIADVGDDRSDSGVFLEAKSFSGGLKVISDQNAQNNILQEGCAASALHFVRYKYFDSLIDINFNVKGSAVNQLDFTDLIGNALPQKITFNKLIPPFPASDTVSLWFKAPFDALSENNEDIHFQIINTLGCEVDTIDLFYTIQNSDSLQLSVIGNHSLCAGDTLLLQLNISNGHAPFYYNWNSGENLTSFFNKKYDVSTIHEIVFDDVCDVPSVKVFIPVEVHQPAANSFVLSSVCENEKTMLSSTTLSTDSLISWKWIVMNESYFTEQISLEFPKVGNYPLTLITATKYGCSDTLEQELSIVNCELFVSNVITPNGDGYNDFLYINDMHQGHWQVEVYDRWGIKLYEHDDYQNDWSPSHFSAGVYYYSFINKSKNIALKGYAHVLH